MKTGWFVLSDEAFDADPNDPIAARSRTLREGQTGSDKRARAGQRPAVQLDSDDEDGEMGCKKDVPRDVHAKKVTFDPTALAESQYDEVEELARKMHVADVSCSVLYTRLICLAAAAVQAWAASLTRQLAA